jgi:hypothetical protein
MEQEVRARRRSKLGAWLRDQGEMEMNIRLTTLCLGVFFALNILCGTTRMSDECNQRTEFQLSAPVEIPGSTLAPGKYIFQLGDSESDRNIVQIFSAYSTGKETLVTRIGPLRNNLR